MSNASKILGIALCTATLAGCGTTVTEVAKDDQAPVGNASPAASPQQTQPDGTVIGMPAISDLDVIGNTLAVRSEDALLIGTVEGQKFVQQHKVDLSKECGDVTASTSSFISACPDDVKEIHFDGNISTHPVDHPASVAVKTSSGEIITGNKDQDEVWVYREGQEPKNIRVEKNTDQMIRVGNDDGPDAVVRINREYSVIQDVHWEDNEPGPILRVGSGVGTIAPGERGVLLASDTVGNQLALYAASEIIRLHQTIDTPPSPWAVAWDQQRQWAWTVSTQDNVLLAYSPATGTLERQQELRAVENATSLAVTEDGVVVAGSNSGAGLQIITPK
ncbi:NHL repeat-containing protein [Corynebacterium gerontici]|uniref:Prolipoprotein LppL n=1 Tax=Corynebacterium gerontici TaxID=2079234 RepID=A0A3G6J0J0_9CORY|nr:hypothetical protein [Corynebacterium gerontici]AZA11436.1 hypothetical protein CGERO_05640 [Corynebacterium gerontici]